MEGQGQGNGEEIPTPAPPPPPPAMSLPMPLPLGEEELAVVMGKKRGRPRKYGAEGFMLMNTPNDFSSPNKRGRGRPPGSGNRQLLAALGEWFVLSAGGNFTPHVVTIAAGEDVTARILSFSQKGPRSICILSANGAISNVTLRQPGSSGGTLTYEGRFEILSLSGSFTITENGGLRSRTGGISVSLAGPDGRVVGGGVAGLLLAAGPIQVVVGSFSQNTLKKKADPPEPSTLLVPSLAPGVVVQSSGARPISPPANPKPYDDTAAAQEEEASQEQGEEFQQENSMEGNNRSDININPVNTNSIHRFGGLDWQSPPSEPEEQYKPSPDINISLPGPED